MALRPAQAGRDSPGGTSETGIHIEPNVRLIGALVLESWSRHDQSGQVGGKFFKP